MSDHDVTVEKACGLVLVRGNDKADMEHRWWFETTEAGRLVFVQEVIECDERFEGDLSVGRHFVPEDRAEVPDKVADALHENGYGSVVDTDGKILASVPALDGDTEGED